MKKLGVFLFALFMVAAVSAQDNKSLSSRMAEKNIFNHMDVGVNVGTMGIGVDVAVPVGDYVRIRTGYNYMPRFTINSKFNIGTRNGSISNIAEKAGKIDEKLTKYGIDINSSGLEEYKEKLDKFRNVEQKDYVQMELRPSLHQFKFLVDVMPFKNNKHWNFTAGFFVGPSIVGDACNQEDETLILEGINEYNSLYINYPEHGIKGAYLHYDGKAKDDPFYKYGVAGFPLGKFSDGDVAMMIPDKDATAKAEMSVSKIRPYLGFGYNTSLSSNKKWNMTIDAGVMFFCGAPKVYVDNVYKFDGNSIRFDETGNYLGGIGFDVDDNYYGDIIRWNPKTYEYEPAGELRNHVDLVHDLHDIKGKVGNMVNTISKFKVYPNVSVTVSYRIF